MFKRDWRLFIQIYLSALKELRNMYPVSLTMTSLKTIKQRMLL